MNTDKPYEVTGPNPAEAAALAGHDSTVNDNLSTYPDAGTTADTDFNQPLQVSENYDDMSFGHAFAAARQAMGPGGSFVWHGNVYSTYYQSEWDAMTPQQQHDFTMAAMGHTPVETPLEVSAEEPLYAQTDLDAVDDNNAVSDNEVKILGLESVTHNDSTVNLASFDFDGHSVVMIDLDNDNVFDLAVGDFDNSGQLLDSNDDILDIEQYSLSVDDVAQAYEAQNQDIDLPVIDDSDFAQLPDTDMI